MSELNKKYNFSAADEKNFADIMKEINGYMSWHKDRETPPSISELDQFHKSWFYNNWLVRFRALRSFSSLGTRGVIAIPNTSFEEWLWWFHEWAEALTDDYNEFKQMVYEALQLIQKHLEAIDKMLENHEQRITNLEREVELIKREIQEINNQINNLKKDLEDVHNQIKQLGDDITKLGDRITNLQQAGQDTRNLLDKIINNLKNSGAWNPDTNDFNNGRNIATGNINFFGGAADGGSFIRTNNGQTENDVTAGI